MPKARPVSLHPLNFEEALKRLINIAPDKVGLTTKRRSKKRRLKRTKAEGKAS